jgi:glycosyltransferase involved in cell wall biosynthesis
MVSKRAYLEQASEPLPDRAYGSKLFLDSVTPLIITFNEIENIARTLEALAWAKQIVVIDSGSTDGTLDILAANPRVRVIFNKFEGFAQQCMFGLSQIETEWVLSLDADYVLTNDLQRELAQLTPNANQSGFRAAFVYLVHGKPLRGALYPARTILYRRALATYNNIGHGHKVVIAGQVDDLSSPVFHDDRKPLSRWLASQTNYARAEAAHLLSTDPSALRQIDKLRRLGWLTPPLVFFFTLFVRGCAWDGLNGWHYALQRLYAEILLALQIADNRLIAKQHPSTKESEVETSC